MIRQWTGRLALSERSESNGLALSERAKRASRKGDTNLIVKQALRILISYAGRFQFGMAMEIKTLYDIYSSAIARRMFKPLVMRKVGGTYVPITGSDFGRLAFKTAAFLRNSGIGRGDRIAIMSYNMPEWHIVDFACHIIGAISVPIYSTASVEQVEYVLRDSESKLLFVQDEALARRIGIRDCIIFVGGGERNIVRKIDACPTSIRNEPLEETDTATIIYTSGTTGEPKGVILTHKNLVSNVVGTSKAIDVNENDVVLSFLPLSHVFERMVDYLGFYSGGIIAYAEDPTTAGKNMAEVRPTVVAGVPRFFEKVKEAIEKNIASRSARERKIAAWALNVGKEAAPYRMIGAPMPPWLAIRYKLADLIVLRKIRARLGGRIRYFVSGGAALRKEVGEFLYACGFTVLEGYGLTETSPVISVNTPEKVKLGTVGRPIEKVEVRIAEDGEILVRGPNVSPGYYRKPQQTAEVFIDGWFHTGDIGERDADGFLKIVDRKKDLFKTAGGKYIAPQPIESSLKTCKIVADAIVIGDGRKFPACVVFVDVQRVREEMNLEIGGELVCKNERVLAEIQATINRINSTLSEPEQIKKFCVITEAPSIDGGTMTPTMKLRRRAIEKKYSQLIESLYSG